MLKYLIALILIIILLSSMESCTDVEGSKDALRDLGMQPIEVGGYGWFGCAYDGPYSTKFTAYSTDKTRIVTGCVCAGLFSGKTIKLD
jgi:hypothetical protein